MFIYIDIFNIGRKLQVCVRSLTKAQESFKLVLILPICHTISVNSGCTFLSPDFCI